MPRRKGTATGRLLAAPAMNGLEERVEGASGTSRHNHKPHWMRAAGYTLPLAAGIAAILFQINPFAQPAQANPNYRPPAVSRQADTYQRPSEEKEQNPNNRFITASNTPLVYLQQAISPTATVTGTSAFTPTTPFLTWFMPKGKEWGISNQYDYCWDPPGKKCDYKDREETIARDNHTGIDVISFENTMVVAAAPGKVMPIQRDPSNDEYGVLIDHANGYGSSYTHMDNPADMPNPIKVGQKIERGQIIGKFKRYGLGGGHVHFAVMFINDGELGYGTMGPYRRISQPVSQYNQNLWLDDRGRENCPHYAGETDAQDCIGDFWPPYTATATPSSTSSPTQVATYTPTTPPTATPNFTATPSQTGTPTATSSPTAVATFTPTGTPSPTPNFTPTPTPTNTPTSTPAQATPEPVVCGAGGRVVQKATGQQTCQYFANVPVVLNYTSGNQNIAVTGATTAAYTSAAADYRISATRPALR